MVSRRADDDDYSEFFMAGPMPAWARDQQVPGPWDTLIRSDQTVRLSATFAVPRGEHDVMVGSTLSLTTCIEQGFPPICAGVAKPQPQGRSVFRLGLTARQIAAAPGASCAVAVLTEDWGAGLWSIGWEQHHANVSTLVGLTMSQDPGCTDAILATTTITGVSGNPLALHSGTITRPTSVMFVAP